MNEFDVIRRVASLMPARPPEVKVPVGDDCAVFEVGGEMWLAAADMLVEGRHFEAWARPEDVGYKAVAVNVSDVAAMGGRPRFILVSGGAPEPEVALRCFEGVMEACEDFGVYLLGGDTTGSESLVVDVAILGSVDGGDPVLRSGAGPGDLLAVTGELGASAAGLLALQSEAEPPENHDRLIRRHLRPEPRPQIGAIAAKFGVSAMIDLSDGLSSDARHICASSGVGADIHLEKLPVARDTRALAEALGRDPALLAATGGEDYELLISAPEDALRRISEATETPVTVVGEVVEGGTARMLRGGSVVEGLSGWDHFSRPGL